MASTAVVAPSNSFKPKKAGRSPVWELVHLNPEDNSQWVCNKCNHVGSRGHKTDVSKMGTANAKKHLMRCCPKELKAADERIESQKQKENEEARKMALTYFNHVPAKKRKLSSMAGSCQDSSNRYQPSIKEGFLMNTPWGPHSKEATAMHLELIEMLAEDKQPLHSLERSGFRKFLNHRFPRYKIMSQHFYNENTLMKIYDTSRKSLQNVINEVEFFSFDTDIWQNLSKNSFISLVAHCTFSDFKQQYMVLSSIPFNESHTGINISDVIRKSIKEWSIPSHKVHVILHDNASNMNLAIDELSDYTGMRCFIHTTQLLIKDVILLQSSVVNVLDKCRKFCAYFNHSAVREQLFKKMQVEQLNKNINECKTTTSDDETRWDSKKYMIERTVELKPVIVNFITEYNVDGANFTNQDWKLLGKLNEILKQFKAITDKYSHRYQSLASDIIPEIMKISKLFKKWLKTNEFPGLRTTLNNLKEAINKRYDHYLHNENCILATYLDPRHKLTYFKNAEIESKQHHASIVIALIHSYMTYHNSKKEHEKNIEITEITNQLSKTNVDDKEPNNQEPSLSHDEDASQEPGDALLNTAGTSQRKLDDTDDFEDFVIPYEDEPHCDSEEEMIRSAIQVEVKKYNAMAREDTSLPHIWWAKPDNNRKFPYLAILAKKYLSAPATSVESERLFSIGGDIHTKKRCRLSAVKSEILMFLGANLQFLQNNYDD